MRISTRVMGWHQAGVALESERDFESVFYECEERRLFAEGVATPVPGRKALVRQDTQEVVGVVGASYRMIQFQEMARLLIDAAPGIRFERAGLFANGARAWILGEVMGAEMCIRNDPSPLKRFLLGVTGHDAQQVLLLKSVPTRIVCSNAIPAALSSDGAEWRVTHAPNAGQRLRLVGEAIGNLVRSYSASEELFNALAAARVSPKQLHNVLDQVMPLPEDGDHPRIQSAREKVLELVEGGTGISPPMRGTGWGVLNGLVEWSDHFRPMRRVHGAELGTVRLESASVGRGAGFKQLALSALTTELGVRQVA